MIVQPHYMCPDAWSNSCTILVPCTAPGKWYKSLHLLCYKKHSHAVKLYYLLWCHVIWVCLGWIWMRTLWNWSTSTSYELLLRHYSAQVYLLCVPRINKTSNLNLARHKCIIVSLLLSVFQQLSGASVLSLSQTDGQQTIVETLQCT